jgi:uncharacterized protein
LIEEKKEVVRYRMERAQETLEEARLMAKGSHWNACANRLYYACFYSVTALLLSKGLSSAKHSGTRSLFNQHFVRPGMFSQQLADFYNTLYDFRQKCDYEDLVRANAELLLPKLPLAEEFVVAIKNLLESS